MRSATRRKMLLTGLLVSQLALTGCASEQYTFHSFSFRAISESPDIEVLDYQYGAKGEYEKSGAVGLRPAPYRSERVDVFTGVGVAGNLPKGDFLYVKWRIKETGQICEDKVDLTTRLPKEMRFHALHFVVKGGQLYVYLIPPDPPGTPPFNNSDSSPASWDPGAYRKSLTIPIYAEYFKRHQIYPDQLASSIK